MSLFSRFALVILAATSLTSCQTLGGLMNTLPFRLFDEAGAEAMRLFSENAPSTGGRPETMQQRAQRVEMKGDYVGRTPMTKMSRGSSVAVR
ncbi:MAG: hypothetical protein ACKO8Z_12130 [Prosthecobacter sp.]